MKPKKYGILRNYKYTIIGIIFTLIFSVHSTFGQGEREDLYELGKLHFNNKEYFKAALNFYAYKEINAENWHKIEIKKRRRIHSAIDVCKEEIRYGRIVEFKSFFISKDYPYMDSIRSDIFLQEWKLDSLKN